MEFKDKNNFQTSAVRDEILNTILFYDQGYCLLEGISASSIAERELSAYTCKSSAPKKDLAPHLIPFFKASVNGECKTFIFWDTFASQHDKLIDLLPISNVSELKDNLLCSYNFIMIYGIENSINFKSDKQLKRSLINDILEMESQQTELKKRKQEKKDILTILNKRKVV